jgi:hypothetical protein
LQRQRTSDSLLPRWLCNGRTKLSDWLEFGNSWRPGSALLHML